MSDETEAAASGQIHRQVLYHLLARDGARVLGWNELTAVIAVGDEAPVLVLPPRLDELRQVLPELTGRMGMSAMTLLVAGGSGALVPELEALAAELHGRAVLAHLADDGAVWSAAPLSAGEALAAALREIQAAPGQLPVPSEEVDALISRRLAEARAQIEENQAFRDRLQGRRPVATTALLATMIVVFLMEAAWGGADDGLLLAAMGGNAPDATRGAEPWRALSATFLHGGLFHLMFNGMALWSVGGFLERLLGPARLLLLFTASAAAGGVASAINAEAWLSVGASGGVWGLFCGAGWLAWRGRGLMPANVAAGLRNSTIQTLMLNILVSFMPRVDLWAHFGGGLAGLAVGALGGLAPRAQGAQDARPSPGIQAAGALAAILLWGSLGVAFISGRPWALDDPQWTRTAAGATGLSLELPLRLGPGVCAPVPAGNGLTECSWGQSSLAPLVVQLVSAPREPLPDRAAQEAQLAAILAESRPPVGATRVGELTRADRPDAPGFQEVLDWPGGLRERRRLWVLPDRDLSLSVATLPDNRWAEADVHILNSLRVE